MSKIKGIESKFYGDVTNTSLKLIGEAELTEEIELLDGEVHSIKIEYENQNLNVYIDANTEPLL